MITRVDTVLIGKTCPASYTTVDSLAQGAVALFDENKNLIKNEASAVKHLQYILVQLAII